MTGALAKPLGTRQIELGALEPPNLAGWIRGRATASARSCHQPGFATVIQSIWMSSLPAVPVGHDEWHSC